MSRQLGSNAGHQTPRAFSVVLGQVQLLLQLSIDGFADQAQAIELLLSRGRAFRDLVGFDRSQQVQGTILIKIALQSRVSVGSSAKQKLQVMGKRVEQFDDWLIIVAAGRSEQETHDEAAETDHRVQLVAKVF